MSRKSPRKIDMLSGSVWDKMFVFALPLALTGVLQQLFNAADVVVLGRCVSSDAMAGVGNNMPIMGLIISFCMGLALGANVVVARFLGMRDEPMAGRAAQTAFGTAVVFGICAVAVGEAFAGLAMDLLDVPEAVRPHAETYLRVYLLGMPFVAVYNFLAAVMRSRGDTRTPLWALVGASLFNALGNLFFVLVCGMGAGGVALATVLANAGAAAYLTASLARGPGPLKLDLRHAFAFDGRSLRAIVRIGWPAGLQGAVFSLSNLVIQSAINSLGPDAMVGSVAALTIELNVYCFINAFSLAATTFVSQNYGAGNLERCRRSTRVSMGLNFVLSSALIGLVLVFGRTILGGITDDPAVLEYAWERVLWVVIFEPTCVVMEAMSGAMRGYGNSLPPAAATLVCICGVRLFWIWTVFAASPDFVTLMIVYPVSWAVTTVLLAVIYYRYMARLRRRMASSAAVSASL